MKLNLYLSLAIITLLLGCSQHRLAENAATIGYQKANFLIDTGYTDKKISHDKYEIWSQGHPYTPQSRLANITIARAAHIGIEKGFNYFKIISHKEPIECITTYINYKNSGTGIVPKFKVLAHYS